MDYYGFVYETTNLINGKKYIGQCRFDRINGWESYLGSGTWIKRAVKKYGSENFSRRILFLAIDEAELDRLEIYFIEAYQAVDSKDYYNLKKTARGGDTFTTNPRKEETREIYKRIRSGKGNSQYGKTKSEKMIKSVKEANSKRVLVDGITYDSLADCSKKTGIGITTLCFRLKSKYNANCLYIGDDGKPVPKIVQEWRHAPKKVIVDGLEYDSISECRRATGMHNSTIIYRCKSPNFPNYQYVEKVSI